jgi:hypothetical protein
VICLARRALEDSVRPRLPSGASVRPLNFTVRRQQSVAQQSPIETEPSAPSFRVVRCDAQLHLAIQGCK